METWLDYENTLTPEQVRFMQRCDANDDHPNGPDRHRGGMVAMAQLYGSLGAGRMN